MQDYYKFDERWEIQGIKDLKSYEEKFVIKGSFHSKVPKDVKEAFITAEHLMAHAYYCWGMYDEALNKCFRILEMAVKLKAKELDIPLKRLNKKGKEIECSQSSLIDQIFKGKHYELFKSRLQHARKIRNFKMHPDGNSYAGGLAFNVKNVKNLSIVLNDIFQPETYFIEQYKLTENIERKLQEFNNHPIVLESNEPSILIYKFLKVKTINNQFVITCLPIIENAYECIQELEYINLLSIRLSRLEINSDEITGISLGGNKIRLFVTSNPDDIKKFEVFTADLARLSTSE